MKDSGTVLAATSSHLSDRTMQADLAWRVTHVRDGDAIEVSGEVVGTPARFAWLDCTELEMALGSQVTRRTMALYREASGLRPHGRAEL